MGNVGPQLWQNEPLRMASGGAAAFFPLACFGLVGRAWGFARPPAGLALLPSQIPRPVDEGPAHRHRPTAIGSKPRTMAPALPPAASLTPMSSEPTGPAPQLSK